jgi:hypothetical protein
MKKIISNILGIMFIVLAIVFAVIYALYQLATS